MTLEVCGHVFSPGSGLEMTCQKAEGHHGEPHQDSNGNTWDDLAQARVTIPGEFTARGRPMDDSPVICVVCRSRPTEPGDSLCEGCREVSKGMPITSDLLAERLHHGSLVAAALRPDHRYGGLAPLPSIAWPTALCTLFVWAVALFTMGAAASILVALAAMLGYVTGLFHERYAGRR